jgi:hypothetical protein
MKCLHCKLEIEPVVGAWALTVGFWHHVEATENNDGTYSIDCADGRNQAEPDYES